MANPVRDNSQSTSSSASTPSRSSFSESRSPPQRTPSLRLSHVSSAAAQHRQSFSDFQRHPPSPRGSRQPSISQLAVQDLYDNPPHNLDPKFAGRDWRTIQVRELTTPEDLRFVQVDTSVEDATHLLIDSGARFLLIRENVASRSAIGTFDYADLNAYLLMVVGLAQPDEAHIQDFQELAKKGREGRPIPVIDVKKLSRREPLTTLPHTADLLKSVEAFGQGHHRVVIVKEGTNQAVGVLSQSRLVRFLWENGRSFPVLEQLYHQYLRDLKVGSKEVISINGDRPLTEALTLLLNEGVSSLAVLDNGRNVIGNISNVDVKLLTKSSSLPLLRNTCIHFVSVILSTRGMYEGQDSFPVFYVTPFSTLAHTVAKLVATRSHRMWITEPVSPSSSGPPTPSAQPATLVPTSSHSASISSGSGQPHIVPPAPMSSDPYRVADASPKTPVVAPLGPSISASSMPGARLSGQLVGVISLTDVIVLFAKATGLSALDPSEIRRTRRRSSSSSVRGSIDLGNRPVRPSGELVRGNSHPGQGQ